MKRLLLLALFLLPAPLLAQGDPERLRSAKSLFFDRRYAEARAIWEPLSAGKGADAEAAAYWTARCSESLGEPERALREFTAYLARHPVDRALAEEARTSQVGLAVKLARAGQRQHLPLVVEALKDDSRTVRYYAALQLAGLGPVDGRPALPVLREIVDHESDADLVDRAKLGLLRVDPKALAALPPVPAASPVPGTSPVPAVRAVPAVPAVPPRPATWVKVRIFDKGEAKPKVSLNLPVALAELVFKSLPDEARAELKKEGYDADSFWQRLKRLGPTEILSVDGKDGERVQVWIE